MNLKGNRARARAASNPDEPRFGFQNWIKLTVTFPDALFLSVWQPHFPSDAPVLETDLWPVCVVDCIVYIRKVVYRHFAKGKNLFFSSQVLKENDVRSCFIFPSAKKHFQFRMYILQRVTSFKPGESRFRSFPGIHHFTAKVWRALKTRLALERVSWYASLKDESSLFRKSVFWSTLSPALYNKVCRCSASLWFYLPLVET